MAQQAVITINDRVPTARQFTVKGSRLVPESGKTVAKWTEASAVNAEGDNLIVQHFSEGSGSNGITKHTYVLTMPTLETVGTNDSGITPPAQKAYENVAVLEFRTSRRSTIVERENLFLMMKDLAASTTAFNEVRYREGAW